MLLAAIHATEGILWFCLLTLAARPLSRWLTDDVDGSMTD